jgi:hypothetical protein
MSLWSQSYAGCDGTAHLISASGSAQEKEERALHILKHLAMDLILQWPKSQHVSFLKSAIQELSKVEALRPFLSLTNLSVLPLVEKNEQSYSSIELLRAAQRLSEFGVRVNEIGFEPDLCKSKGTFRHSAGFGKRIEYWIIGRMLKEGLDVYIPMVDDDGIDAVIRRKDGKFITVQIKARSSTVIQGNAALFAAIDHEIRENYWFIFYSERLDSTWIMTSDEFVEYAVQNKTGKNAGKRSIWFNGKRRNKVTGEIEEYCKDRYEQFLANDFARFESEGT